MADEDLIDQFWDAQWWDKQWNRTGHYNHHVTSLRSVWITAITKVVGPRRVFDALNNDGIKGLIRVTLADLTGYGDAIPLKTDEDVIDCMKMLKGEELEPLYALCARILEMRHPQTFSEKDKKDV